MKREQTLQKLLHDLKGQIGILMSTLRHIKTLMDQNPNDHTLAAKYIDVAVTLTASQEEHIERIQDIEGADPNTGFKDINIETILEKILIAYGPTFKEHGITCRIVNNINYNVPIIKGSSFEIKRIFRNLLQNSIEAMKDSIKKEITIQIQSDDDAEFVRCVICDSGTGFDPSTVKNIFGKDKVNYSTKQTKHHGYGLQSVRDAVEIHGGTIRAENRQGEQGAKIIFRLKKQ